MKVINLCKNTTVRYGIRESHTWMTHVLLDLLSLTPYVECRATKDHHLALLLGRALILLQFFPCFPAFPVVLPFLLSITISFWDNHAPPPLQVSVSCLLCSVVIHLVQSVSQPSSSLPNFQFTGLLVGPFPQHSIEDDIWTPYSQDGPQASIN